MTTNKSQSLILKRINLPIHKSLTGNEAYDKIRTRASNIKYVDNPSKQMIWIALEKDGTALKFIPDHLLNEGNLIQAVSQNGLALQYIPAHMQTTLVAKAAIVQNQNSFKYICEDVFEELIAEIRADEESMEGEPELIPPLEERH